VSLNVVNWEYFQVSKQFFFLKKIHNNIRNENFLFKKKKKILWLNLNKFVMLYLWEHDGIIPFFDVPMFGENVSGD